MKNKRRMTKMFHGMLFICQTPGEWVSHCGCYGIYHMLADLAVGQWEAYKIVPTEKTPLYGKLIGCALSMREVVSHLKDELEKHWCGVSQTRRNK